jgi:hypothetical protein
MQAFDPDDLHDINIEQACMAALANGSCGSFQ